MARDDDGDSLDDVLDSVVEALDALELGSDRLRDSLVDGVREALSAIVTPTPDISPDVVVLDGGRAGDPPTEETEEQPSRPDLQVLEGDAASRPEVRVRVVQSDDMPRSRVARAPIWPDGRIRLRPSGASAWQTVYHGTETHPYRLHCTSGVLRVSVDGQPVEELHTGCSIDIEAKLVRVSSDSPTDGLYRRL
jgi:hypothetical protein